MSSLMKELTTFIGVNHVKSSPYHPQTNGALERLHGTFKSVLKKSIERKIDWVQQLPFALFVLRQMPSTDHGLSPFELIYGSRSRTPLEALYYGLMEHEGEHLKVSPWVNNLTDRLQIVREEAAVATAKAIERRKTAYDRSSKLRAFNIGEKVRYRIPGMHGSLSESWDGPYVVQKKYGMVNYRIQREGVRTPGKVTHINNLMKYAERKVINRLDIVTEEEIGDEMREAEMGRDLLKDRCPDYNEEQLMKVIDKYKCLSDIPGQTELVELSIDTGDNPPIQQNPYSVPMAIRDKVRAEIVKLEKSGIIERSSSKWSSPLVPVKKPDDSIRLCGDFRKLNSITKTEPYYIPKLEEMVSKVGRAKVLSKLDLTKGFHQIKVKEEDRDKLTFSCPFGKWRYKRMPFGVASAPATFQRLMDVVLEGCSHMSCVYIDDVLIWSDSWEDHLKDLDEVFRCLSQAGLTCKPSKCQFGMEKLVFLGHTIGGGEISVPKARVKAMEEFPRPRTKKQLRSFLGTVNFYRKFVNGISKWQGILTPATSKEAAVGG